MGKLTNYMLIMSGLMLLFYFAGLIPATANSTLLNMVLQPENMPSSGVQTKIILAIEAVGIVAAVILGFLNSNTELVAMGAFTVYLLNLGWDFIAVFTEIAKVNKFIAVIVFGPIFLIYIITMIEFWRGRED